MWFISLFFIYLFIFCSPQIFLTIARYFNTQGFYKELKFKLDKEFILNNFIIEWIDWCLQYSCHTYTSNLLPKVDEEFSLPSGLFGPSHR